MGQKKRKSVNLQLKTRRVYIDPIPGLYLIYIISYISYRLPHDYRAVPFELYFQRDGSVASHAEATSLC